MTTQAASLEINRILLNVRRDKYDRIKDTLPEGTTFESWQEGNYPHKLIVEPEQESTSGPSPEPPCSVQHDVMVDFLRTIYKNCLGGTINLRFKAPDKEGAQNEFRDL